MCHFDPREPKFFTTKCFKRTIDTSDIQSVNFYTCLNMRILVILMKIYEFWWFLWKYANFDVKVDNIDSTSKLYIASKIRICKQMSKWILWTSLIHTTCNPKTLLCIEPYLIKRIPPAAVATFPPIKHEPLAPRSIGIIYPWGARRDSNSSNINPESHSSIPKFLVFYSFIVCFSSYVKTDDAVEFCTKAQSSRFKSACKPKFFAFSNYLILTTWIFSMRGIQKFKVFVVLTRNTLIFITRKTLKL